MAKAAKKIESSSLNVGDKAPAFSMATDGGGNVALKDYAGKKNVVLYFYPKDDTPGCTTEAKDFSDLDAKFKKTDTVIIGVSKDPVKSHDKFKTKYCLPFTLASDEDGSVCEAYGVWVEKSMYGKKYMGIQRATFLIDKKGSVAAVWPKVSVTGHAAEVLKTAESL
ncbi:MAG: thioredoxin-dependent thiol peroxidase [Alphaproteobacteria bacterium]|nr:thioredoxin-dependent thiol peroxidase [Alphaproteobacteria bacterium]